MSVIPFNNWLTFGKMLVDVWYGRMPCEDKPFRKFSLNSLLITGRRIEGKLDKLRVRVCVRARKRR